MPPTSPPVLHKRMLQIFGVLLGIMIFGGFLFLQVVFLLPPPCNSTFGCPTPSPDQAAYSALIHGSAWVGLILLDLAVGLSVMFAFLLNAESEVPETTKRSAFYFASIFLASFTLLDWILMSFLLSYLRYV